MMICSGAVASCRLSLWDTGNHGGVVYCGELVRFLSFSNMESVVPGWPSGHPTAPHLGVPLQAGGLQQCDESLWQEIERIVCQS